jgi:hypothetical protein
MLAYLAIFTGINAAKEFGATPGLGGFSTILKIQTAKITPIIPPCPGCNGSPVKTFIKIFLPAIPWTRWNYWRYFCRLDFKYCRKEIA